MDRSGPSPHPPEADKVKRVAVTPPPPQEEELVKQLPVSPERKLTNGHDNSQKSSPESVDARPSAPSPAQPKQEPGTQTETEHSTEEREGMKVD